MKNPRPAPDVMKPFSLLNFAVAALRRHSGRGAGSPTAGWLARHAWLGLALTGWLLAGSLAAQPAPVLNIFGVHNYPPEGPIDAVTVNNFGSITVSGTTFAWDTQNTLHFINQSSGTMVGTPGFQLDYVKVVNDTTERLPLAGFTNLGSIFADERITIFATNLVNAPGALLSADRGGTVHLEALNGTVNLFNSAVRAGESSARFNFSEADPFINDDWYLNPANVMDEYWGRGDGGNLDLDVLRFGGMSNPNGHTVTNRALGDGGLGITRLRQFLFLGAEAPAVPGYSFYVRTNFVRITAAGTSPIVRRAVVQMVFVQTNLVDSPEVQVYFFNNVQRDNYNLAEVAVELGFNDLDPITGAAYTRYLRVIDRSITNASAAGVVAPGLFRNEGRVGTSRPDTYGVVRSDSPLFGVAGFGTPATPYDPNYVYSFPQIVSTNIGARFQTNRVPHVFGAYQFSIRPRNLGDSGTGVDYITGNATLDEHNDPTNSPGRVEIDANSVNLRQAIIRAENLVSIKATNVIDMSGLRIDAQNVNFDFSGTNSTVVVSNVTPSRVSRLHGAVTVWSGAWQVDQFVTNAVSGGLVGVPQFDLTNTIEYTYHMMVVDLNNSVLDLENGAEFSHYSPISTNQPVAFQNLRFNSASVELHDTNTVTRSFYLGGTNWLVGSNANLTLGGVNTDFTYNNAPFLINFTNLGTINVPQVANFGYDRFDPSGNPAPYSNIVNRGSITSGSLLFRSANFENSSNLTALSGALLVDARTNRIGGGQMVSLANLVLSGDEFILNTSNNLTATLFAGGRLELDLTNRITDSNLTNLWTVSGGFGLNTKPAKGDLLSTRITSLAGANQSRIHYWAGEDRGDTPSGYANNAAVGELVLDGASGSRFGFLPRPGQTNALYLDTLTLLNDATNYATALSVDANMTIYFAHANVPGDKLTNAFGGRFVWVSTATRSGLLVTVRSSMARTQSMSTQAYEALLASSPDVDGDGIANELDETPFSGFTISSVQIVDVPPNKMALISWQALAGSAYTVEYRNGLNPASWSVLGTYNAAATGMMTVGDLVPPGGQRFYRVRYGH